MVIIVERVAKVCAIVPRLVGCRRDNPTPGGFTTLGTSLNWDLGERLTFIIEGKLLLVGNEPLKGRFQIGQPTLRQLRVFEQVVRRKANCGELR